MFVRPLVQLLIAAVLVFGGLSSTAHAQPFRGEPKYTAIVMDYRSGEVLYAERADSPRYPASVTKLMTFYLAFEALTAGRVHLNDYIVVSPLAAAQPPTKLGLRAGESIRLEDALHAMAVHSANDMAIAVSERLGGSEARFAAMMNITAQRLGMFNTHYVNANGLPDSRQISTARDLALLSRALLRDYPQFYSFFSQQEFTYRGRTYVNTNHLLGKMPGVDGLKTGFTNAAGFNLAASAMRNGNRLIAVVMGGSSGASRNENVENLLLTGFDVLERRARGEHLQLAQNLFTPGQAYYRGAPAPAQVAQGDADDDPIDLVLTGSMGRAQRVAAAQPTMAQALSYRPMMVADLGRRPGPLAPAQPVRRDLATWWVQVGVFKSEREAKKRVETVSHQFGRFFDEAVGKVDGGGRTAYAARFSGLTQTAAESACANVRARGLPCEAHGPA